MKNYNIMYEKLEKEKVELGTKLFEERHGVFNTKEKVGPFFENDYSESSYHDCLTELYSSWSFCKKHFVREDDPNISGGWENGESVAQSDEILNCKDCECTECWDCDEQYEKNKAQFFKETYKIGDPSEGRRQIIKELFQEKKAMFDGKVLFNIREEIIEFFKKHKIEDIDNFEEKKMTDDTKNTFEWEIANRTGSEYIAFREIRIFLGDHFIGRVQFGNGFFHIGPGDAYFDLEKKEFHNENTNESFGGGKFDVVTHGFVDKEDLEKIMKILKGEL